MAEFRIERLGKHLRKGFDCGVDALNKYLIVQAGQEMRRRYSVCYVLVESSSGLIAGFYTLSASSVPLTDLPADLVQRLPRYAAVPVARVGRLAVDLRFRLRGLGGALVHDAWSRSALSDVAVHAMVVDAKDESAAKFYERFGFIRMSTQPLILFMPIDNAIRKR